MSGDLKAPLERGDTVVARYVNGDVRLRHVVLGYTSHGKVRLMRIGRGTTHTAWWATWLPRRHFLGTRLSERRVQELEAGL